MVQSADTLAYCLLAVMGLVWLSAVVARNMGKERDKGGGDDDSIY